MKVRITSITPSIGCQVGSSLSDYTGVLYPRQIELLPVLRLGRELKHLKEQVRVGSCHWLVCAGLLSDTANGCPQFKVHFATIPVFSRAHIIPGGIAMILGEFQFHPGLRKRWINVHRYSGLVLLGAQYYHRRMAVYSGSPA